MFWGTGNPAPWASQSRPGDNLYTASIIALRPKTGEMVWYYQTTPGDQYDYDANWEVILADLDVAGADVAPPRFKFSARNVERSRRYEMIEDDRVLLAPAKLRERAQVVVVKEMLAQ